MDCSSPPTPICIQSGALNFILETVTAKCGQCLGWRAVIVGWKSALHHCCEPVVPWPHAPWEPFMDSSCATILCWTAFGSTVYQRSQPVWEGHCSGLLKLVRSWSWLSSLHPACSVFCSSAVGALMFYTCYEHLRGPQAFWTTWCVAFWSWPYESLGTGLQRWEKMSGHLNLDHYLADLCNLITRILSLIVCSWLLIAFQA